jgi:hypothetical protein
MGKQNITGENFSRAVCDGSRVGMSKQSIFFFFPIKDTSDSAIV